MSTANVEKTIENLKRRGYRVQFFQRGTEAADYLSGEITGTSVGFGGSVTASQLKLYDRLKERNAVFSHSVTGNDAETYLNENSARVYITSANAIDEDGNIINIDGRGNRVAATLYGAKKVYIVVGINKLEKTFEEAIFRARNIAAPKNAQRLKLRTPCATRGDRCYDCSSPDRICNGLVVLWRPVRGVDSMEVVIVNESLGY